MRTATGIALGWFLTLVGVGSAIYIEEFHIEPLCRSTCVRHDFESGQYHSRQQVCFCARREPGGRIDIDPVRLFPGSELAEGLRLFAWNYGIPALLAILFGGFFYRVWPEEDDSDDP